MRSSQPPAVASWILERFAVSDNYAVLSGDLTEEYRSGRSPGWYWRQVLVAILVGVWKEILDHKLLTIRAIATGSFVSYWLHFLRWSLWKKLVHFHSSHFSIWASVFWSYNLYNLIASFLICIAVGWIVARSHRRRQTAMVFAFFIFFTALSLWTMFPMLHLHLVDSISDPRFRPYLAFDLANLLLTTTGVLIGGLISSPPENVRSIQ